MLVKFQINKLQGQSKTELNYLRTPKHRDVFSVHKTYDAIGLEIAMILEKGTKDLWSLCDKFFKRILERFRYSCLDLSYVPQMNLVQFHNELLLSEFIRQI